jgi:phosphoglycerol transferase MdoB-like AlkP superfamily enzyme
MLFWFSLGWIWLIVSFSSLIAIFFFLFNFIPALFVLILQFYGLNWFTVISHSIAGLLGVISILYFFYNNPPELVSGDESVFIFEGMWKESPLKTVCLALPFTGLILGLIWSSIVVPISLKFEGEEI